MNIEKFGEDYYLRGKETGVSNYQNYRWLGEETIKLASMFKKVMNIRQGQFVLDFGAARGFLTHALRLLEVNAFGYDISKWANDNCHPEVRPYMEKNIRTFYDHIISKDCLEHCESLEEVLKQLFFACQLSCLFIVPLCHENGGSYIAPPDNQDATHINRFTFSKWTEILSNFAGENWIVLSTLHIPVLKLNSELYPGSTGFYYCRRING